MQQNPYQSPSSAAVVTARIVQPIQVSGRLTYEDYWAVGGIYTSGGKWQKRFWWLSVISAAVGGLLVLASYWIRELQTQTVLEILTTIRLRTYLFSITAILVLGGIFGLIGWGRRIGKAASDAGEGIYAIHYYEFTEEKIDILTSNIKSQFKWDAFSSLRQNDDYLVLHLKPEGSASISIARKWFDDPDNWYILVEYANQRIGSHRGQTA